MYQLLMSRIKTTGRSAVLLCALLWSLPAQATWLEQVSNRFKTVYDPLNPTVPVSKVTVGTGTAVRTVANLPSGSGYTDVQTLNKIEFGIDVHYPQQLTAATDCEITFNIQKYDITGTSVTSTETGKTLNIVYDPLATTAKKDRDVYLFTGHYKYTVTITQVKVNGSVVSDLPFNMYLDMAIDINRIEPFSGSAIDPAVSTIDLDSDGIPDELSIDWATTPGAEEYQLEWTFVNYYNQTAAAGDSATYDTLAYSFRNNSTRITTTMTDYRIPVLFDRGHVIFRLRGLGRKTTYPYETVTGDWGGAAESGTVNTVAGSFRKKIQPAWVHENEKNWQVTTTFAEEGKKKEVVSYFDGSLRNRQTITRINTDENVVVGETYYDYQGRPALTVLPVPVEKEGGDEKPLRYYAGFNRDDSGTELTAADFDTDLDTVETCELGVDPLSTGYGAGKYYSPNNPDKEKWQAHVPDAGGYPYTQVEYTPDNTGRIQRQGGVGETFQLGSGHETKYFYGQPNQEQLDRLFGSETGDAAHYKKNVVVDPNGQVSVSYLDQEGRVVATALAGDAPTNLTALPSEAGASKAMTIDLFAKDAQGVSNVNTRNISGDAIEFQTQYTVSSAGNHTFSYELSQDPFTDACMEVCFNCVYNLQLSIKDACGVEHALVDGQPVDLVVGQVDTDEAGHLVFNNLCSTDATYSYTSSPAIYLGTGTYTVSKILRVNEEAVEHYVQQYLDKSVNSCVKDLADFETEYLEAIDFSDCAIDCDACLAALGDRDEYVSSGKGSALDYDFQVEECKKMCRVSPTDLDIAFSQMKADMSPGGQYGEYLTASGAVSPGVFPLSIYNESNKLPQNINCTTGSGLTGKNWHYPVTILNGTTYYEYLEADGSVAVAYIHYDPVTSTYSPDVHNTGGGLLTPDGTGTGFTTPVRNLKYVIDFVSRWKPEWALGLVTYHPEYIYYQTHLVNSSVQDGETMSSDDYDALMMDAASFAEANTGVTATDFISGTGAPYDPWDVTGGNLYDPWFNNIGTTYKNAFITRCTTYMDISGVRKMHEAAAIMTRCGLPLSTTVAASCDDFGTGVNTAWLDGEWDKYKTFYQQLKKEFRQKIADEAARTTSTYYGLNDCIGNNDDYNPFTSGMINLGASSIATYMASPYFKYCQPCGFATRNLYSGKIQRFPDVSVLPGYATAGSDPALGAEATAYQTFLQTGQCPKASAVQAIFNELAALDKVDATSEDLTPYASFNAYYVVANHYAPTVSITTPTTGMDYDWVSTVMSTHVLKIEWKEGATVKQTFTLTKPATIGSWDDIEMFSHLEATGSGSFTVLAHLGTGLIDTITATTDLNLYNCTFSEVCDANAFATDLQALMGTLAFNGALTSSGYYDLNTDFSVLLTPLIKSVAGTPHSDLEWKYDSGSKTFILKDGAATNKKLVFTVLDPASPVFTSVKYYEGIVSNGSNVFSLRGRDASGTLIHTLRLSALFISETNDTTAVPMGSCGLPDPLACQEDPYVLAKDLRRLLGERLSYAAAQTTYPTSLDFYASPFMSDLLSSYFTTVPVPVPLTYTPDYTGPQYEDQLSLAIDGCTMNLYMSTTNNVHFEDLSSVNNIEGVGTADINGAYTQFKLTCKFGAVTDYIYGSSCIPIKNCLPCGDEDPNKLSTPNFVNGTLECSDLYTRYTDALSDFASFKASHSSWGLSNITAAGSGYFNEDGYCKCAESYIGLLEGIMSGGVNPAGTNYTSIATYCGSLLDMPCAPAANVYPAAPLFPTVDAPDTSACEQLLIQQALVNAQAAYTEYVDSLTTIVAQAYRNHCLGLTENFTAAYTDKEYHFTLYYYDQAGNLVKTVPPAGVELLDLGATYSGSTTVGQAIKEDRSANGTRRVYTSHRLASTYEYNSLNQLVRQYMPDHDAMTVWNPVLTYGIDTNVTITKIQFFNGSKGFLSGFLPGNRGVLYTSNDAGYTWQKVNDVVGATINKVCMVTGSTGYAAGNSGVILKTTNGGSTWDMLNTYAVNVNEDVLDLAFESDTKGVFILKSDAPTIVGINGSTLTKYVIAGTGVYNRLSAITYSATTSRYIVTSTYKATSTSPETGVIFHSAPANVTSTAWTANTTINANQLNKVSYSLAAGHFYAGGNTGTLGRITLGGTSTHYDISANLPGKIIDVYYATANDAVVIAETVGGQGQIYRTSDGGENWTLLSEPGEYFKSLSFYQKVVDASGDIYKLTAVGPNSLVRRVILQVNNPGGVAEMPNVSASAVQLNASWAVVSGTQTHVLAGGNSGALYYCKNATGSLPLWYSQSVGISGNVIDMTGFADISGNMAVYILTESGSTYTVYKTYKAASAGSFSTATTCGTYSGTDAVKDLSASEVTSSNRFVYFVNNADQKLYKINASIDNSSNLAASFTTAISAYTGKLQSLASTTGTGLVVCGDNGLLYSGTLNSATSPSTVSWTSLTGILQAVPFTDVQKAPGSGLVYATTGNGDVYENHSGNSWKKLDVASYDHFNAMCFGTTATDGLVAADNGRLYNMTITTGSSVSLVALHTGSTAPIKDVAINGSMAAAVADDGLILVNNNYPLDAFAPALAQSAVPLYGLSVRPGSAEILCVGAQSQVRKIAGNTSVKINQVYTPNLNSVHFYNTQEGYLAGDNLTARHTSDGGATWQVVLPTTGWSFTSGTLPNLRGVFTKAVGNATLVGTQGKVYFASGNTLTVTATSLSASVTLNDVESSGIYTFAVGTNGTNKALIYHNGSTWSNMSLPTAAGVLNGIHTFERNNGFVVVGSSNVGGTSPVIYYGRATSGVLNTVVPSGSVNLYDVHFIDDINGYVVGSNGTMLKTQNLAYSASGTMDYTSFGFGSSLSAGPLSGQTSTSLMDIRTVYAIDHTHLMSGGVYNSAKVYARLITDESQRYSTRFWYDRLGRIVVSQNTRQYTAGKYSYTLYDALGRVVEAGEKTENGTGVTFAGIFGAWVNTHWNPNVINDTQLSAWVGGSGARSEVTRSYYDQVESAIGATLPGTFDQDELRKRISCVAYYPTYSGTTTAYDHATHYSYDIHGNVKSLLQENRKLAVGTGAGTNVSDERYNRIDYTYDLISGNVHQVSYESGKADQWHHRYAYDGDNRITSVSTSDNAVVWDKDARYFYYAHGPLARTEYGENSVQAVDYAYTLQGWIKGTNSNDLDRRRDIGRDGYIAAGNENQHFAKDVAGYTLNYYDNDYKPIDPTNRWTTVTDRFEASKTGSNIDVSSNGLYNGNIRAMVTTVTNPSTQAALPQATLYGYDQLNRLLTAKAWTDLNTTTNVWGSTSYAGSYQNDFTYDANGNILTQLRKNQAGTTIDNLTYNYYNSSGKILQNRLYHVNDAVSSGSFSDDIDNMNRVKADGVTYRSPAVYTFLNTSDSVNVRNNYSYDAEGRLVRDRQEEISQISWRVDGKVAEVQRTVGSSRKRLKFDYDAMGQRIAKHQYAGNAWEKSTYYVRDAQGNVLATYNKENPGTATMKVTERDIYGSSRVGLYKKEVEMISATTPSVTAFQHETGLRQYELSNHLGNVLAVITDRKRPLDLGDYDVSGDGVNDTNTSGGAADNRTDYYQAEIVMSGDYSPFGVALDGRTFSSTSYRYGFNGMEKDEEIAGEANSYTAEYWQYDSRLGRRWNIDPVVKPWQSGYTCFSDDPINRIDPNGDDDYFNKDGKLVKSTKEGTAIKVMNAKGQYVDFNKIHNKTTIANIAVYYASKLGANDKTWAIGAKDHPSRSSSQVPAYTRGNSTYLNTSDGLNSELNDYNNVISSLEHELFHKQRSHGFKEITHYEHTIVYFDQVNSKNFSKTTATYKEAVINSVENYLNLAADEAVNKKPGVSIEKVKDLIEEFNKISAKTGYTFTLNKDKDGTNYTVTKKKVKK